MTFTPSALGSRPGTLTISEVGVSTSQTVSLSGTGTAPILVSIAVTPATASVAAGDTQQFAATGTYSDGSQKSLTATWTSSATSVATVKSATGLATGVAQGTATITATSGKIKGTATLTVTPPVLTSIAVTPATASVAAGNTEQYTATGTYSNGSKQNLTSSVQWASSSNAVATVNSAGLATGVAQGTATISATSGTIVGTASLTVTAAVLTSIAVTPSTPSIAAGNTQQFTATGTYSNGTQQNLTTATWTSSATSVATINSSGLATGVAQGTTTITATSGKIKGSTTLTVTPAVLVSIAVTPATASIAAGNNQQFTATGTYSNGSQQNLTSSVQWSSSATAVASVSSGGLATGVAQGAVTIIATSGAINGSAALTVTAPVLTSLTVSPGSATIAKGTSEQFTATGTYSDGSQQNLTATVSWSTSSTTVATISSGGLAMGAGIGTATVTASMGAVVGTASLNVGAPVLVSLAVTPANPSFALGTTEQMTATGTYSDGSTLNVTNTVTWATADTTVATVNGQGLVSSAALGSTGVTATSGAVVGTTQLTVTPAVLVTIAVTPAIPTIALGLTQQFTATGTYTDGSQQNITGTVQWSSDTPAVATISNTSGTAGLATSVGQGTAGITASVGGVTGTTQLTVSAAALETIVVTPAMPAIPLGTTQQFTATGTFTDGSTQNLTSTATWSSDTPGTATISNTAGTAGLATSVGQGTAGITASVGGVSGTTELTVTAAALVSIAVSPGTGTIPLGQTEQFTATGTYTDGSQQDVTQAGHWSSTAAGVATISNTPGSNGLATSAGVGTTTIGISLNGVNGTATLVVNPAALVSIAINPQGATIALGLTQQFTATGTYTDGSQQDVTSVVTWSSTVATVAIISNSAGSYGLLTSAGQGTTTVAATLGSVSSSTGLTVAGPALVSMTIAPMGVSIPLGTSQQFTATGTYTDGSTQDLTNSVTWASDTPSVASVSASGLVTGLTLGTANISATSGTVSVSTGTTVTPPILLSLTVSPGSAAIAKGTNEQFTATGTYSDGSQQNLSSSVNWSSSLPSVATIGSGGAATGVGIGTATVTASMGAVVGTASLNVAAPVLVSLAVTPANPSFALGTTEQLAATGTYSDGSTLNLTNTVTWSTGNTSIATVNGQGLVSSAGLGSTGVTATSGAVVGTTQVTVTPAVLVSIAVTPAIPTIPLGTTQQFTATGTYTDGSQQNITGTVQWSSDTPAVATISNAANAQGMASSVAQGTATITATAGAVTGSTTLTVSSAVLESLAITPATPSLALGTQQQFTATGTFTDGSTQNLTSTVTWSSDTPSTATINNAGMASSVGTGTANIAATSGSVSASTLLTVTPAALVSITINPPTAAIPLGTTQQFTATGTFTDGTTQDITQSGQWSSTVATVATISNTAATAGLATTLATGTTTIGISSGGVNASVLLTVNPAVLASISITPQSFTIALGTSQQMTATGTYTDGGTQDVTSLVTWGTSPATVAIVSNTLGSYGLVTSSGQGTATITATSGSVSASTTITVGQATATSVTVTPSSASITAGSTEQFTAVAIYSDGSTQDVTQSATWASSNPNVALVSSSGLATAALVGTTTVSASAGSAEGSALLTVSSADIPDSAIPLTFFAVSDANPLVPPILNYGTLGHPVLLAWQTIEQASGVYDFSLFDDYANIAPKDANGTALMIMTLGMTPPWALPITGTKSCRTGSSAGGTGCTAPPDHIQDWINFITTLINHYNGTTAPHIKYYELWNEADPKSPYWTGTAAQLEQLAAAAYPIIKQDPYSFVITPSMAGNVHATGSSSTLTFFNSYLAAGGNQYADIASFHGLVANLSVVPYPLPTQDCSGTSATCGGSIIAQVNAYRQVLNQNGMSTTPLFNTEGGFESATINLDTGAAWLAQYYALQATMYGSSQLQLVSWFAWDTNDGQLETGNNVLTKVGVAYAQVSNWLVGNTLPTPCSNSGTIWTCAVTGANGYQAEIIWDSSQTCTNGTCTYSNQSVANTPYTRYLDLAGDPPITITNQTVPVGLKPILLQNQ